MRTAIVILLLSNASLCWAQRPLYYDWNDQQQDRARLEQYMRERGYTPTSPYPSDNGTGIFHGLKERTNLWRQGDTGYSYSQRQYHDQWLAERYGMTRAQFDQLPPAQQQQIIDVWAQETNGPRPSATILGGSNGSNSVIGLIIMAVFGVCSSVIGVKHGHRWWTTAIAGTLLGPIGIALAFSKLTLQPVTKAPTILKAEVVDSTRSNQQVQEVAWPAYSTDKNEPYGYGWS